MQTPLRARSSASASTQIRLVLGQITLLASVVSAGIVLVTGCGGDDKSGGAPVAAGGAAGSGGAAAGSAGTGAAGEAGAGVGAAGGAGGAEGVPLAYLACGKLAAGTPTEPPAGGEELTDGWMVGYDASGVDWSATFSTETVTGQSFTGSARATVVGVPPNTYSAQFGSSNALPIASGDVLLADVWLRCEKSLSETGTCQTELVLEDSTTYAKSIAIGLTPGKDWKRYFVAFSAKQAFAAEDGRFLLRAGYKDQTLEVGTARLWNYKKTKTVQQLPTTAVTYAGIEDSAPWRAEAAEHIEQLRKGELTVKVVDAAGKPVSGAKVSIKQKQHKFGFGTAVASNLIVDESSELPRFDQEMKSLFNLVTLENALKWQPLAGDWGTGWGPAHATQAMDWVLERGIPMRGHVLVWPSWRNSPKALRDLVVDPAAATAEEKAALRAAIDKHIDDTVALAKGKVVQWDVVNETFDNHDLTDILGEAELIHWFQKARAGDPKPKLYINDYAILAGGGGDSAHRQNYERVIKLLVDGKAPLDGIGMQGHFNSTLTPPVEMLKTLDRYGKFGKDIAITEYDIDVEDPMIAACFTRDVLTTVFSHERATDFVMWGFWDGAHWKDNAPVFTKDWTKKLSGQVFEDLVKKVWWTDTTVSTGADGSGSVRAFLGAHDVSVTVNGKSATGTVTVDKAGATLQLTLK